jgi:hypothetical protein
MSFSLRSCQRGQLLFFSQSINFIFLDRYFQYDAKQTTHSKLFPFEWLQLDVWCRFKTRTRIANMPQDLFTTTNQGLVVEPADLVNQSTVFDEKHSVITQSIIIFFYSVIFMVGLVGNSLVVFVVCRNKTMQSVTNVFITNLAVSDILM